MGHDIEAFKMNEISAYYRRNSTSKNIMYKALNCEDLDAGVSGNGDCRVFYKYEIEAAIKFVKNDDLEQEADTLEFLEECLKLCNDSGYHGTVLIWFS